MYCNFSNRLNDVANCADQPALSERLVGAARAGAEASVAACVVSDGAEGDARRATTTVVDVCQVTLATMRAMPKSIEVRCRPSVIAASEVRKESDNAIGIVYGFPRNCESISALLTD